MVHIPKGQWEVHFSVIHVDDILLAADDLSIMHETKIFSQIYWNERYYMIGTKKYFMTDYKDWDFLRRTISKIFWRNLTWIGFHLRLFQYREAINLVLRNVLRMMWNKEIKSIPYSSITENLMCLQTCTRPTSVFWLDFRQVSK